MAGKDVKSGSGLDGGMLNGKNFALKALRSQRPTLPTSS